MNDQELRRTPTHSAEEFQGSVFAIETGLFLWVGASLLAGIALFAWLFYARHLDFFGAAQWAALPVLVVVAYLRFCHQGKPPGYTRDVIDSLLTGGHAVPPHQPPPNPFHDV